jgi:hypothetical protein
MADDLGEKALVLVDEARDIVIQTNDDLERANQLWVVLDKLKKNIKDKYDDVIKVNHEAWKFALAKKAQYFNPVDEQAKVLKLRIGEYKKSKELERKGEEARLYDEAVKQEEDRRRAEAEQNPEQAAEILSEPISVAPVILPKDLPAGGPVLREIWDAEVFDFPLLIKAVAEGRIDELALEPNGKFLRQQATSFRDKLKIDGVRAFSRMV